MSATIVRQSGPIRRVNCCNLGNRVVRSKSTQPPANHHEFGAGSCTITIENRDNFITPGHSDSPQGNTQLIGREVRVSTRVTGGSDSYDTYLFRGQIADVDYIPGNDHQSATTILKCVDGFELLARAKFSGENFVEQVSSARISAVLDLASVNYPNGSSPNDRTINTGSTTLLADSNVTLTPRLSATNNSTENGRSINHGEAHSHQPRRSQFPDRTCSTPSSTMRRQHLHQWRRPGGRHPARVRSTYSSTLTPTRHTSVQTGETRRR